MKRIIRNVNIYFLPLIRSSTNCVKLMVNKNGITRLKRTQLGKLSRQSSIKIGHRYIIRPSFNMNYTLSVQDESNIRAAEWIASNASEFSGYRSGTASATCSMERKSLVTRALMSTVTQADTHSIKSARSAVGAHLSALESGSFASAERVSALARVAAPVALRKSTFLARCCAGNPSLLLLTLF